ncbi:hypothetical protein P2318_14115 [Myxococcaceae bacterium GXIMD 01537]
MRASSLALSLFVCSGLGIAGGCAEPGGGDSRSARVEGRVLASESVPGDAYVFLFAPGEGPPEAPGTPLHSTAVPALRRAAGETRFRFPSLRPGTYRLWGFLDVNGDVDLSVDVLAQPGAGDRVPEGALERAFAEGEAATVDLSLTRRVRHPLPAFRVVAEGADAGVVSMPEAPSLVTFDVEADGLGLVRGEPPRFYVRFLDVDGDGMADDADGDGLPDLYPRFFLRWAPAPGQGAEGVEVVVPLLFNPAPFATVLQGDVTREAAAERLQLVVVPQARAVTRTPDGGTAMEPLGTPPVGDYVLWALTDEGTFWHVPNALGARDAAALRSQALRFRVVRAEAPDAGTR